MFRTVFVRSISALTVSGFVLAAQPLVADAGDDLVLASFLKATAFAKDGDSGNSGSGSGSDGDGGSDSSGSGSSGDGDGDSSGRDGPGDGDGDSSGRDGPGDGDGDSSGRDGPGDNDGDNSGPGGGDRAGRDDGDDGRGRGRGRARGHDDHHGHHSQPRNLTDFFTGNQERGAVVKAEMEGQSIEVTYTDGWKEEIEHGRYELKDPSNRTVVERPATQDDVDRLNSAF